jgi:hypothetical protein
VPTEFGGVRCHVTAFQSVSLLRQVGIIADWWSVAPAVFADGGRTLRKWLADPNVSQDLKVGDAELLARFEAHHAERRRPKYHLLTQEEMDEFTPEQIEHMVTVELQKTYTEPEAIGAMRDAVGQTFH